MLVMPRCGMTSAPPCGLERGAAVAIPANRQRRHLASHPSTTSPAEPRETQPRRTSPKARRSPCSAGSSPSPACCALATPLGASASSGTQPEYGPAKGPYGPTLAGHLPVTTKAKGRYGPAVAGHLPATTDAKGPYGPTVAGQLPATTKATGPYQITSPTVSQVPTTSTSHGAGQMHRWRTAAIVEAAARDGGHASSSEASASVQLSN